MSSKKEMALNVKLVHDLLSKTEEGILSDFHMQCSPIRDRQLIEANSYEHTSPFRSVISISDDVVRLL